MRFGRPFGRPPKASLKDLFFWPLLVLRRAGVVNRWCDSHGTGIVKEICNDLAELNRITEASAQNKFKVCETQISTPKQRENSRRKRSNLHYTTRAYAINMKRKWTTAAQKLHRSSSKARPARNLDAPVLGQSTFQQTWIRRKNYVNLILNLKCYWSHHNHSGGRDRSE